MADVPDWQMHSTAHPLGANHTADVAFHRADVSSITLSSAHVPILFVIKTTSYLLELLVQPRSTHQPQRSGRRHIPLRWLSMQSVGQTA